MTWTVAAICIWRSQRFSPLKLIPYQGYFQPTRQTPNTAVWHRSVEIFQTFMMRYLIGSWWKSLALWQFTAVVATWHSTKLYLQQLRTQLRRLDIQSRYERNLCNAVNGPRLRSYNTVHMPDYKHRVWNIVSEGKVCGNLFIFSYFMSEDTLLLWSFVGDWCDGNMNVW